MKSPILKLVALIALLTAGGFSSMAQNNGSALSSANNPASSSTAFAVDKNIISVEISNLVDAYILEYEPYSGYGGFPEAWSPHFWTIKMFMAEGTDVTSLAPIINLAPGATIKSKHADVQDFSQPVEYTVICEDGSTVTYFFSAYTENTRAIGILYIEWSPFSGGGTTSPLRGTYYSHDENVRYSCMAFPNQGYSFERWYVNDSPAGTNPDFYDYIPLYYGAGTLLASFVPNSPVYYTVTVLSQNSMMGTVSGGGSVAAGSSVYISASPKSGWVFEGWYLNGSRISTTASYYYYPSATCTLIAKFTAAPPPPMTITGPSYISCDSNADYYMPYVAGATYTWSSDVLSGYFYNHNAYFFAPGYPTNGMVACTVTVGGVSTMYMKLVFVDCWSPSFIFYPNPASGMVNIKIDTERYENASNARGVNMDPTYDIRLYNGQGNLVRNTTTKSDKTQLNLSGLPNGVYYLHVYDGISGKPEVKQIIVQN